MPKRKKKVLVEKIKEKDDSAPQLIEAYLFSNAIIKIVISYFILVIGFCLVSSVNKLSFISPKIFFTSMLLFIAFMVLFIAYLSYLKFFKQTGLNEKILIRLFDLYDLLSFIFMTINICFFIVLFILTPTVVNGSSMNYSFYDGDRILVWHLGYSPKEDDAIIIDVTSGNYEGFSNDKERFFIKRVVATSGDKVEWFYSGLRINGTIREENRNITQEEFKIMTTFYKTGESILDELNCVKSGYSIVLGDNRLNSYDSRELGAILDSDIQGKVVFIFYSKEGNFGLPKKIIKTKL